MSEKNLIKINLSAVLEMVRLTKNALRASYEALDEVEHTLKLNVISPENKKPAAKKKIAGKKKSS